MATRAEEIAAAIASIEEALELLRSAQVTLRALTEPVGYGTALSVDRAVWTARAASHLLGGEEEPQPANTDVPLLSARFPMGVRQ